MLTGYTYSRSTHYYWWLTSSITFSYFYNTDSSRNCSPGRSLCHMRKKNMITLISYSSVYRVEWTDCKQHATRQARTSDSQRTHHEFLLPPLVFNFRRELFYFAVSFSFCLEFFFFTVSFSVLPWAFLFCCELFFFAVNFSLLPWHLWATVWCFVVFRPIRKTIPGHRGFVTWPRWRLFSKRGRGLFIFHQ